MKSKIKNRKSKIKIFTFFVTLFACLFIFIFPVLAGSGDTSLDDASSVLMSEEGEKVVQPDRLSIDAPLCIIHPPEGSRLPSVRSSFVYGAADPNGRLWINGQEVPVHPGGGFLTMVDYSSGSFLIKGELKTETTTHTVVRSVTVLPSPVESPVLPVTIERLKPGIDMFLRNGDQISVLCKGSPEAEAFFQIKGVKGKFPMPEVASSVRGIYQGVYVVRPKDKLNESKIKVTLVNKKKRKKKTKYAEGRVSRFQEDQPVMARVVNERAVLRAAQARSSHDWGGYAMFPPKGVKLCVIGKRGNELRIRLSDTREAWLSENDVQFLPSGTPPPRTMAGSLFTVVKEARTQVQVFLGDQVPFDVRPSADRRWIDVLFYGVGSNTDWMTYDSSDTIVSQMQWFQDDADTYRVRVHTPSRRWWGFDARYEKKMFVLELARPRLLKSAKRPLEGLVVAVDAGHSLDRGAIGATGLFEKNANMAIARALEKKLLSEGAGVVMIREEDEDVPLYDRPKMAWALKADVYISVHNNALPEGKNPFERNGYGVYYFHAHSFPLAWEIHRAYGEVIGRQSKRKDPLRDDGLHYGNLAVVRTCQMPSVLTESAYMMVPREEALLKTPEFQSACAEAMLKGLKRYVLKMRKKIKGKTTPSHKKTKKRKKRKR